MKKFTIMLSALLAFGSLQSFAQTEQAEPQATPSTKSEFNGTGYYRLKNVQTGRYLRVYGDVFKTEFTEKVAIFTTGGSINFVPTYGDAVSDPGTVLYVKDLGKDTNGSGIEVTNIEVMAQGTGLVENLNYDDMNAALKDFGIEGTKPQVSIRKTGEIENGRETYFIETFQDFGPLAVKAVATARAAAAAGVPGAAERLAKLLEFAKKVAGHDLDYTALAKVTGLKFIDLGKTATGGNDFTISYDYTDPAHHIIFIGKNDEREDKDSKAAQWYIEPVEENMNVFGLSKGVTDAAHSDKLYSTLFVSFPFAVDGVNTKAFYGEKLNGNTLEMAEITEVPAFTPVLIEFSYNNAHKSQCTPILDDDLDPIKDNLLGGIIYLNHDLDVKNGKVDEDSQVWNYVEGSSDKEHQFILRGADNAEYKAYSAKYDSASQYVFGPSNDNDKVLGFYEYTKSYLANNKAFLKLDGSAPVKGYIRFDLGDKELTAINGVITDNTPKEIFDLSGRRVENPTTGLYIVNGKKVLVK